ncbi:integral component of membrane [Sergentomyia squamirostris]
MKTANSENQSSPQFSRKMLAKILLTIAIGVSVSSMIEGNDEGNNISTLKCYTCNSDDDPGCFDKPEQQRVQDCGLIIADLSSFKFRCMTIKGHLGNEKFAMRRCSTDNECNFQLRSDKSFEWGTKIFPDASCDECQGDLCNKN